MASRPFPRESRPPSSSSLSASVQMGSSPAPSPSPSTSPPMPMIGRAGNLTVFITPPSPASTPRSSRPSDSPRPDFSTPTSRTGTAPPPAQKSASPPAPPVKFSPPAPPVKVSPVQVPPPQYGKASAGGKHDGSAFGFLWDAVARVQEAHASLDEYVANWFGLDQSKYQWALNDYYDTTGKEVEYGKAGKPKELTTTTTTTTNNKVQKV
nr:proline-rich receptor-like protein kinase PERK13 [Aegilops tauschii subsp. strangulata]